MKRQETLTGWAFLTPFLAGFCVFVALPLLYTIWLSFFDANTLQDFAAPKFAGLRNFAAVLASEETMSSYLRSLVYSLVYVPSMILASLFLALLLNRSFPWRTASRTMIFMPYVANVTAVAIVFNVLLNPFGGPVNALLGALGVKEPPLWLMDPRSTLPLTALIATWENVAFQTIVFIAALQDVPEELYEAARIEGAGAAQRLFRVTLPLISPTTFFLVVTTIIGSTQNFSGIYTLTQGGPGDATEVAIISIYKSAFEFNQYSLASAQSILLFLVLLMITVAQWKGQKRWVNY
jgi:ABC-type sugar transport systems, permease components